MDGRVEIGTDKDGGAGLSCGSLSQNAKERARTEGTETMPHTDRRSPARASVLGASVQKHRFGPRDRETLCASARAGGRLYRGRL